jgi:1-acyl-sn-glycerol-3-phosphate acyltransferase
MKQLVWNVIGVARLLLATLFFVTTAAQFFWRFRGTDLDQRLVMVQALSRRLLGILGVDVAEQGERPQSKGSLLVANHISFTDILVINAVAPSTFVSKDGVAAWPLIGYLVTSAGTIYLERGSRRAAHRVQERITEHLAAGGRVAFFPEGTTTDGTAMLPFHGALFQAAIDANAAIDCALLRYVDSAGRPSLRTAYVGDLSLIGCLWQIAAGPRLTAQLSWVSRFEPPHADRRHLAHHAHQRISHALAASQRATET